MTIVDWADRSLLLAVDTDADQLGRIEGELQRQLRGRRESAQIHLLNSLGTGS